MARPGNRIGLDYFPMDVDAVHDKRIQYLIAKYGVASFGVYVYILGQIYDEGYALKWDDLEVASCNQSLNLSEAEIKEMLDASLHVGLFDQQIFDTYHVLTSAAIQRRFLAATCRRKNVDIDPKYCLVSDEDIADIAPAIRKKLNVKSADAQVQVSGSSVPTQLQLSDNSDRTQYEVSSNSVTTQIQVSGDSALQRKEKKRKEKESKTTSVVSDDLAQVFEAFENGIRPVKNEIEKDEIVDMIIEYGAPKVLSAIEVAVKNHGRTTQYVAKVLRNWAEDAAAGGRKKADGIANKDFEDYARAVEAAVRRQTNNRNLRPESGVIGNVSRPDSPV